MKKVSPIIKWAGGKEKELKYIIPNIPINIDKYFEPFVGGGSVFFNIKDANELYINDKSKELIALYEMVKTKNERFFKKLYDINYNWVLLESIVENNKEDLVKNYKRYSNNVIKDREYEDCIIEFILKHVDDFNGLLSSTFNINIENFIKEIKINFTRKTKRMKDIEINKGKLEDEDIIKNIETCFKSAYYMHFRYLYNTITENDIEKPFAVAIYYYIREYCYASMFRYNSEGKFNVPYGGMSYNRKNFKKKIDYLKSGKLLKQLEKTQIFNIDFYDFLERFKPKKGDFIFLDPPYDSDFSNYSNMEFGRSDQIRLAKYLETSKSNFMLVIKNTSLISSLYKDKNFNLFSFDKEYLVSFQNRNDKKAEHLVITNYY